MTGRRFHAYVGCRTTRERNARGEGIAVFEVDEAGRWAHRQTLSGLTNPSFLAFNSRRRFLYAVHGDGSDVSAFRIGTDGLLTALNKVSVEGRNPVHLALAPDDRFLLVANHLSSAVAVLAVDPESGHLRPGPALYLLGGEPGPHRMEQPFAKPHGITFDPSGRFVLVPDKGVDRIFVFRFDAVSGALTPTEQGWSMTREAAGPRHVAIHPGGRFVFCLNELDSTIAAYRLDPSNGALKPFQVLPSVPDSCTGNSRAAELAMTADGRFLYASNRGHDSVMAYAVDPRIGRLSPVCCLPSGGRTPRFIGLDPDDRALYVANEENDAICRFNLDADSGRLLECIPVAQSGSPTCITFRVFK